MALIAMSVERVSKSRILITGGAGYIGAHLVSRLLNLAAQVIVVDNFSAPFCSDSIGSNSLASPIVISADIRDTASILDIFSTTRPDMVIHLAGSTTVFDSTNSPHDYFGNNVAGSVSLLRAMALTGCNRLIYASSAAVYGETPFRPVKEEQTLAGSNPYAKSKIALEGIVQSWASDNPSRAAIALRMFNPVGSTIKPGRDWKAKSLFDHIFCMATNGVVPLSVFGTDYPTIDGTCVRDFFHISDLIDAQILAINFAFEFSGHLALNIGGGKGTSVLQLISEFEKAVSTRLPYQVMNPRQNELVFSVANNDRAVEFLRWAPSRSIGDACRRTLALVGPGTGATAPNVAPMI